MRGREIAHLVGWMLVTEQDIAADQADIRLLSAQAVMFDANTLPDPVQKTRRARCRANGIARHVSHDRLLEKQWVDDDQEGLYGGHADLYIRHAA